MKSAILYSLIYLGSVIGITLVAQEPTFNPFFFGQQSKETKVTTVNLTEIGRHHYDVTWNAGNIYLNNGDSLVAYYMRYDLVKNQLEVIFDDRIRAINGSFIKSFEWFSVNRLRPEKFVSRKKFSFDPSQEVTGFVLLLKDGDAKLLKCKRMYAPRESTSPTLVNELDESVQSLDEYYLVFGKKAVELSGGKRRSLKLFDSKEIDQFVSKSNLKFSNENDLIEIVEYYNSLNKP